MDLGETTALVTIVTGLLAAFGAGDIVPYVGPAVQGLLALIALGSSIMSFVSHRNKTNTLTAAGLKV